MFLFWGVVSVSEFRDYVLPKSDLVPDKVKKERICIYLNMTLNWPCVGTGFE